MVPALAPPAIDDAAVGGGLPRAAFRLPSGVEEGVMLETVAAEVMSEAVRGEERGRCDGGLSRGGVAGSESGVESVDRGGEGEPKGSECISSACEAMIVGGVVLYEAEIG